MAEVLLTGLAMGESPRWHDGRLWVCDWVAGEVLTVDADGTPEVVARVDSMPFCIDFLPDGRLVAVSGGDGRLLQREDDGTLAPYADLSHLSEHPWNEVVVDAGGAAYVNGIGFDFGAGDPAPGLIARVAPDGSVRQVAGDVLFPNGMAITADGSTLVVAESYAARLTAFTIGADGDLTDRRVWAALPEGAAPDGICLDADGAAWYADVPNQQCVRVAEGGEVLETVALDRGGFACMLGGSDGRTLHAVTNSWGDGNVEGAEDGGEGARTGQVVTVRVAVPHAGRP